MIAILLSLIIVFVGAYALKSRKNVKETGNKPPGPKPFPIIGSSHLIGNETSPFVKFSELADKYGDIYSIKLGSSNCVVVSSLDSIRSVLIQNGKFLDGRPDFIRYNKLFDGDRQNSLALCDWCNLQIKRRNIARKHCDPRKKSTLQKTIADVGTFEMKELVSMLRVKSFEARVQNKDLDLKPLIMSTCLNIFTQYMCSMRFDIENDIEFNHVARLFDEIFWEINQGYAVDFMPWLQPFYKSHMNKLHNWSVDIRSFILSRIIKNRELDLDDEEEEKDFTDGLLKILKREEKDEEEKLFTRNSILFALEDFLGGSSAVGNLVVHILGIIIKNPEVGIRIQQEIEEVTGGDRPVTVYDAEAMPYTMATVKETLRYASSPIVPHVASESAKVGDYDIDKGTVVIINNYKLNMDEKLWESPREFKPERFLEKTYVEIKTERRGSGHDSGVESESESQQNIKSKSLKIEEDIFKTVKKEVFSLKTNVPHFMPFSIGKRTCLGRGLVMNYALVTLATILQNFDLTCRKPETIKTYIACVALPPDTFHLTLNPRQH